MTNRHVTDKVRAAINAGKIRPDQAEWAAEYAARDPKGFDVFVAKAVAVTPAAPVKAIDETQRLINILFGIDDETFEKYGPKEEEESSPSPIDETQRLINILFGIDDETYLKYREAQQNDETFRKYGGRGSRKR